MPYVLTRMVIGPTKDLRISKAEYDSVAAALIGLPEIVAIEEKFDALMENHVELETTLLTLGARQLAFIDYELRDLLEPLALVSRRIGNLLSSARLYRDALPRHVGRLVERSAAKTFIASFRDTSKQPVSFRVVEAIRNYAQHQELPISNIVFRSNREGVVEHKATAFAFWLEPLFDAPAMAKSRGLTPTLKTAFEAMPKQAKIMPLIRAYIEHFGAIHQEARTLVQSKENAWEETIASNINRYRKRYPKENILGLAAGFRHENRTVSNEQHLSEERIAYRKYLKTKNHTAVNFSKRYVKWSA